MRKFKFKVLSRRKWRWFPRFYRTPYFMEQDDKTFAPETSYLCLWFRKGFECEVTDLAPEKRRPPSPF